MFRPILRSAAAVSSASASPMVHRRAISNSQTQAAPISAMDLIQVSSSLSFPYPINVLINARVGIVRETLQVIESCKKEPIEDTLLTRVDSVRNKVLDLETAILGTEGSSLKDFTWGMNPSQGLVSDEEAREGLMAELNDIKEGLVREVNQLVALGQKKETRK